MQWRKYVQNIAVTQGGYLSVLWGETRGNFLKQELKKQRTHLGRAVQRNHKWLGKAKAALTVKKDGDDRRREMISTPDLQRSCLC